MIDRRAAPGRAPFVMAYTLKPGISFCHVAGRTIFLDLRADRYFCLANDAERSFDRLAAASSGPEDMRILEGLAHQGILRASDTGSILQPCPAVTEARASLLDAAPTPVRPLQTLLAGTARAELVLAVKLQPFAAHAWVQWQDLVVNDRVDAVRDFTPILVV